MEEHMIQYRETGRYFAQIADGIEDLGADELRELGARDIQKVYRGLHFTATKKTLYKINYSSRIMTRILAPIKTFDQFA